MACSPPALQPCEQALQVPLPEGFQRGLPLWLLTEADVPEEVLLKADNVVVHRVRQGTCGQLVLPKVPCCRRRPGYHGRPVSVGDAPWKCKT